MKDYDVIANDKNAGDELRLKVKELKLEERLHIFHPSKSKSCPLEVNCRIEDCTKPEESFEGRLRIYIDEENPLVAVSGLNFIYFHPPNKGLLSSFQLDGYIIEIYNRVRT